MVEYGNQKECSLDGVSSDFEHLFRVGWHRAPSIGLESIVRNVERDSSDWQLNGSAEMEPSGARRRNPGLTSKADREYGPEIERECESKLNVGQVRLDLDCETLQVSDKLCLRESGMKTARFGQVATSTIAEWRRRLVDNGQRSATWAGSDQSFSARMNNKLREQNRRGVIK